MDDILSSISRMNC